MRFFFALLLVAVLSAVAAYFLPWWSIAFVSFVVALFFPQGKGRAFWSGFLGVGVFWLVAALWQDIRNEHILSSKMAMLFHLPASWAFTLVTVIVGALVGGLSSLSGAIVKPITNR